MNRETLSLLRAYIAVLRDVERGYAKMRERLEAVHSTLSEG